MYGSKILETLTMKLILSLEKAIIKNKNPLDDS